MIEIKGKTPDGNNFVEYKRTKRCKECFIAQNNKHGEWFVFYSKPSHTKTMFEGLNEYHAVAIAHQLAFANWGKVKERIIKNDAK